MNEPEIEEAERLLSYYEAHPELFSTLVTPSVGVHVESWTAEAAQLLRSMLPTWSAFAPPMRPLTNREEQDYLSGHASFPGAMETEHGVLRPDKNGDD